MNCEYCGNPISNKFKDRKIHKLCTLLQKFANGRSLTENNGYHSIYVPPGKEKQWPNLSLNSRRYAPIHQVVSRIILGRDLVEQGNNESDSEVVDHKNENKKDFSPKNLRVMNLKTHVKSHKDLESPRNQ